MAGIRFKTLKRLFIFTLAINITITSPTLAYDVPLPPGVNYAVPTLVKSSRYQINVISIKTNSEQGERITRGPGNSFYSMDPKSNQVYLNSVSGEGYSQEFLGRLIEPQLFARYNSNSEFLVRFIYATSRYFYASFVEFNESSRKYHLHVVRADLTKKMDFPAQEIFRSGPDSSGTNAWGGAMVVEGNSFFLSIGENRVNTLTSNWNFENYSKNELIQKKTFFGKVLVMNNFGQSPPEIYTLGHRNPYGLVFTRDANQRIFWETEIGPEGGDELNVLLKGKNYGWPYVSYGKTYDDINPRQTSGVLKSGTHLGYTQPIYSWVPSVSPTTIFEAKSSKEFMDWNGNLIIGTLSGTIERVTVREKKVISIEKINFGTRLRNCLQIQSGKIICSTDDSKILLLSESGT